MSVGATILSWMTLQVRNDTTLHSEANDAGRIQCASSLCANTSVYYYPIHMNRMFVTVNSAAC